MNPGNMLLPSLFVVLWYIRATAMPKKLLKKSKGIRAKRLKDRELFADMADTKKPDKPERLRCAGRSRR
jgi:hypothetical protein